MEAQGGKILPTRRTIRMDVETTGRKMVGGDLGDGDGGKRTRSGRMVETRYHSLDEAAWYSATASRQAEEKPSSNTGTGNNGIK